MIDSLDTIPKSKKLAGTVLVHTKERRTGIMETMREENAAEPAEEKRTRWVTWAKWVLVIVAAIALVLVLTLVFLQVVVGPATGDVFSDIVNEL